MSPKPRTRSKAEEPEESISEATAAEEELEGPPPYDPAAVGRVAGRVEISSVELVGAYFERVDDGPLPADGTGELTPAIGIGGVEWEIAADGTTLGCVVNFGATFEDEPEPYELFARFRLTYLVSEGARPDDSDLHQFANWNSVFNAWPYWREYLSSTINRAQLTRFLVPVMGVPRVDDVQ